MKKKGLTAILLSAITCGSSMAQTVNYALENADGTGKVGALTITELDDSPQATIQMWVKPQSWNGAFIKQDNFSVELTGTRRLSFIVGGDTASITASGMTLRNWCHVSVCYDAGEVTFHINDRTLRASQTLPATIPATAFQPEERGCTIGAGLTGRIDEIRVWDTALDTDSLYYQNTVNRHHPDYAHLVAYWKCDQEQCPNLYDYKGGHHGELDGMARVEAENDDFKYRVVTGYTNLTRFIDRPNIDREMYLMTNDVVVLSAKLWDDGSVFMQYPDNSLAGTENTGYLAEWEGRTGIMDFGGEGAAMTAGDPRTFNDPRGTTAYQASADITFEGWFYVDEWNEGAQLVSQYLDEDNCFVLSLGGADERELVLNACGTTATLRGQLDTGRWQYVAVYLSPAAGQPGDDGWSPVRIAVGQEDASGFTSQLFTPATATPVEMGGKAMTATEFPALLGSTLTLGSGFDGKMDEVMVWGSDRSGSIATDATEPYEWNVGSWNNIFLDSYWKGDDPDNPGKDYQSYTHMMDIMRGYYDGYRGYKLRLGLISGCDDWLSVLSDEDKVDRFIASCKELVTQCDGFDVDFEWMYNSSQWDVYNNAVGRLAGEVMAGYPDKTFSCSLHYVSYNGFDRSLMDDVDYFTMQIYGPQTSTYTWDYYETAYNAFVNYGYPKDKLLLSYGILIVNGSSEEGYKDLFETYGFDEAYDPDLNTWEANGTTYYFNGVNQTLRKQQYIIDNDVLGTMYFDMANDLKVTDWRSLIRTQNSVIASNVDTLVTAVDMPPVPDNIHHASTVSDEAAKAGDDAWYDLGGRRVARPGKGIYIRNGQKRLNP